jgi:GT2 family glycosyltransferase
VSRPDVSFVTVAYRSSKVLAAALASLRREAGRSGLAVEVVVVDHSEDAEELRRLERLEPDRLVAAANRGYAAGINTGLAVARGERLLVSNPDIEFQAGALAALLDGLAAFDIVGPQFVIGEFMLPPADEQTPLAEWRRWRAARSPARRRALLRREVARWRRVWESSCACPVPALSGALLAFARPVWERLGAWDEAYFLFFEETDWLRRARRAGLRLAVVPGARVLHRWGHAADARDPATAARFAESRRRFYRRHFGALGAWIAARSISPWRGAAWPALPPVEALPRSAAWWLASPSPTGLPAAGARLAAARLPAALAELAAISPALAAVTLTAWQDGGGAAATYSARGEPEARHERGSWQVRPAAPGDEGPLDRLFERSFGHVPPRGYWNWKYRQAPARTRSVVAVDRAGEVLAHAGALALPARVGDQRVDIWQLVDFMGTTAGTGLRPPLLAAGRRLLADLPGPDDAPWNFGFPSPRHFQLGERAFGYRPLRELTPLVGVVPGDVAGALAPAVIADRAPAAAPAVWTACGVDGVVRSREFLDWRYWARPERYYRFYGFGEGGADGFAVFAFQGECALAAELWMARPGITRRALLGIAADLRSAGFRSWSFWPPVGDLGPDAIAELGLAPAREPVFVGIRAAPGQDPSPLAMRFTYVMGDYDLI